MKRRELQIPKLRAQASIAPETLNEEDRTVEVRFYSGAAVMRYSFWDDEPYELAFDLSPKAVRLERFNAGAPLLDNHRNYGGVADVMLGVVEKAWLADDGGRALVKIAADRPDILARLKDGILRNFSMGAVVHTMRDVTQKGDKQRKLLAIDWEPMELSVVPIPADPSAQALEAQALASAEKFPCTVEFSAEAKAEAPKRATAPKEKKMKVRLLADIEDVGKLGDIVEIEELEFDEELHSKELEPKKKTVTTPADDRAEDLELQDALGADTKRVARLREIATHFELDELWIRRHSKRGSTVKEALSDARKQAAKTEPDVDGRLTYGEDYQSLGWMVGRMSESLASRALGSACPEPARAFERKTIAECGYAILEKLGQTRGRALDPLRSPLDVIKLAMGTTDFPSILANVLNKTLLGAYEAAAPSFTRISQMKQFKDYRPHRFVRAGDFPLPLIVGEGGEITQGAMGESHETITAYKYARILAILWEVLVNDDLNAFTDFGGMVARRIRDNENKLFYDNVIKTGSGLGAAMTDGVAVYNSAHANVNSAGALSNDRLNEAFGLMAAQTSIDGLKINVGPRYVLTSATSHILAKTLLTAIQATQASNVNPWAGIMEPIWDANLSGVRYYVLADPSQGSNYIHGTLNNQPPRFEVRPGFEVEGVQVKVVHDFGCGAVDYRYGVTGAGS